MPYDIVRLKNRLKLTSSEFVARHTVPFEMNHPWRDIIIKKRSSGPTVDKPSERSMQLFDMCSYDVDSFRDFIQTEGFQEIFAVDAVAMKQLISDDEALLQFAFRFLEQVLFGATNIPVKERAKDKRLARRKATILENRRKAVAEHKAHDPRDDGTLEGTHEG